jgi:hypothetical protein
MPGWLDEIKEGWKAHRRGVTEEGLYKNYADVQGNLDNQRAVDKYIFERDNPGTPYVEPTGTEMWRQEIEALMASGDDRLQDIAVGSMGRQQTAEMDVGTADMEEYNFARQNDGYEGTFEEWLQGPGSARSGTYGNQMFYTRDGDAIKAWRMAPGGGMVEVDVEGDFLLPSGYAASDIPTIQDVRGAERGEDVSDVVALSAVEAEAAAESAYSVAMAQNTAEYERIREVATVEDQIEIDRGRNADWSRVTTMDEQLARMDTVADEAIALSSGWSTGLFSPITELFRGSDASNLASKLENLKSSSGFDQLVNLKRQGGTLGAVNKAELDALQGYWATLNQSVDAPTLIQNIRIYQAAMKAEWAKEMTLYEVRNGRPYQQETGPTARTTIPLDDGAVAAPDNRSIDDILNAFDATQQ